MTVWFQNKRQTERKVALHNSAGTDEHAMAVVSSSNDGGGHHHEARSRRISNTSSRSPPLMHLAGSASAPSLGGSTSGSTGRTVRNHMHVARPQLSAAPRRPSLDHVATRAELPQPLPRTPTRLRTYHSLNDMPTGDGGEDAGGEEYDEDDPRRLYEHMPSSPPSPLSPAAMERDRELVGFRRQRGGVGGVRARPTLEWACAVARIHGHRAAIAEDAMDVDDLLPQLPSHSHSHRRRRRDDDDGDGGDTEDEMDIPHEALTPSSSLGSQAGVWKGSRRAKQPAAGVQYDLEATPKPIAKTVSEQDVMDAALALCGLGSSR